MRSCLLLAACCLLSGAAAADEQVEGRHWLERMVGAAHKLDYTGTFVFRSAALAETSRIVHRVDAGREIERIEVLDGSAREVLRINDEIKCYLPDSRTLIIESGSQRASFPDLLPMALAGLGEHYVVRKGPLVRVAERESQWIRLEPRDDLRYGRQFWADTATGLLLKSALVNERGEALESFTFTQLQIGGAVEREAVQSRYATVSRDWQVRDVRARPSRGEDAAWRFKTVPPGFSKRSGMLRGALPQSVHLVYSDGLAAISVFIEPVAAQEAPIEVGMRAVGATNVYRRVVADHLFVLMGEVPQATLQKFGDGIEAKKR